MNYPFPAGDQQGRKTSFSAPKRNLLSFLGPKKRSWEFNAQATEDPEMKFSWSLFALETFELQYLLEDSFK